MMTANFQELLEKIDSGVTPAIALESLGYAAEKLPEGLLSKLNIRHAQAKSKMMASLFASTQRASANPSAIAAAAAAWAKLCEGKSSIAQNITIEIEGEDEQ